jgi:hypothetical protein
LPYGKLSAVLLEKFPLHSSNSWHPSVDYKSFDEPNAVRFLRSTKAESPALPDFTRINMGVSEKLIDIRDILGITSMCYMEINLKNVATFWDIAQCST